MKIVIFHSFLYVYQSIKKVETNSSLGIQGTICHSSSCTTSVAAAAGRTSRPRRVGGWRCGGTPWAEQLRVVEAPKNEELTAKHDGSTTKNDVVLTKKMVV